MSVHDERGYPWYLREDTYQVDIPCFDDILLTFSERTKIFEREYQNQLNACLKGKWVRSGVVLILESKEDAILARLILQ